MKQHYLIVYDISNTKRWREVYKVVKAYAHPVQLSVFLAELNAKSYIELREKLSSCLCIKSDRITIIPLGAVKHVGSCHPDQWIHLGIKPSDANIPSYIY